MALEDLARRILDGGAAVEPWAFTPEGLDWRWLSRGDAAERLAKLREQLGASHVGLGPGPPGAFRYSPLPAIGTLLLDAAFLDLGCSVTVTQELPAGEEPLVQVDDQRSDRVEPGWRFARRPLEEPPRFRVVADPAPLGNDTPACAGDGWGPIALERLCESVSQVPGSTGRSKEVVVTSADLSRFEERCAWLWSLLRGAALVVCRSAEVPAAVGWARPTVLWVTAPGDAFLERTLSFCGGSSDRSKRRALKRLHRVVCVGGAASEALETLCARFGLALQVLEG